VFHSRIYLFYDVSHFAGDLQKQFADLNSLNTQLAANLFLRTSSLHAERAMALEKCNSLKEQVATLQSYVDRYAAVNGELLREGSTHKAKEKEQQNKLHELAHVKQILNAEVTRRKQLEEECHEMAVQIKAMEKENEVLQHKLANVERRASSASTTSTNSGKPSQHSKPNQQHSLLPTVAAQLSSLKHREANLTLHLKQATEAAKAKSLELKQAQDALTRTSFEKYIWLILCVLVICVHLASQWVSSSFTSYSSSSPLLAVHNFTSTAPMQVNHAAFNCVDIMQCTSL
jgi:myosin heavy subunit